MVEDATEWWCSECHRLWLKTSHHPFGLCDCGWKLVGEFTNAEALERWGLRNEAAYAAAHVADTSTITLAEIVEIVRQNREDH